MLSVCADEILGYDATIGFTHWANKPSTKDAFVRPLLIPISLSHSHPPTSLSPSAETQAPSSLSKPMCLKPCSRSNAPMLFGAEPRTHGATSILVEAVLAEVCFSYSGYGVLLLIWRAYIQKLPCWQWMGPHSVLARISEVVCVYRRRTAASTL